ncbi:MAG: tetratricopeptide repeat protein [Myxococcota bacterium]|nr:tetratricopeptide repeat protein [Myxococcota bacterium]
MSGLRVVALLLLALAVTLGCANWRAAHLYGSGTDALDRGDVELAIRDLERAAELAPRASEVQNHLGLAYSAAGRREAALAAFERAVELDCDNAAARENLAVARERLAAARRHPGGAMP